MDNTRFLYFFIILLWSTVLQAQDPVRICAIRVDFQEDTNALTTGNGKFMVDSVTTSPYAIDPAPHNRIYFNDQIIAASNYFENVSSGRVRLEGDVFPVSLKGAYTLPHPMGFYNPNTTDEEINRGLSRLFRDAVELADQDAAVRFGDYDLVVIFHAGVGKDIDVGFDETPQDISSLFLTESFLREGLGQDFSGISVDGGTHFVKQGIILPETENQEGYQIALTGMFVSNIGSYLGLLDLFSASEQRSGVGRFDLMDVGLLNLNGLVPSIPGAFSRQYLQWSEPLTVSQPRSGIAVARFGSGASASLPEIVRIPINETEYYLLEYRGYRDVNIDSLYYELYLERNEEPGYLEVLATYYPERIEISDSSGVLLSVDDYDIGLPGAGILIWHVDERVIRYRKESNRINDDPDYRAVDIEEADGSQDIGQLYDLTQAGFQSELGTWLDFWFNGKNDSEIRPLYKNAFSTYTSPNTRSNLNNAVSHVTIDNFSSNTNPIMTFDFRREYIEEGFPVSLNTTAFESAFTITGKIAGKTYPYVFTITEEGDIYAIGTDGKGLWSDSILHLGKISAERGFASIALGSPSGTEPYTALVAAADSVCVYDLEMSINRQSLTVLSRRELLDYATSPVVVEGDEIYIADNNGAINTLSFDGNLVAENTVTASLLSFIIQEGQVRYMPGMEYSAGFLDGTADRFIFVGYDDTDYDEETGWIILSGARSEIFPAGGKLAGPIALADIENNGQYNLVYSSERSIHVRNLAGNPVANFPVSPVLATDEQFTGSPLLADLDSDDRLDIIAATTLGSVFAYSVEGNPLSGFPLNAGETITGTPVLTNLDDDPAIELVAILGSGTVYAWELPREDAESPVAWMQAWYTAGNNPMVKTILAPVALGEGLMPPSRAYNYPNPNQGDHTSIRYYLNDDASVKIRIFDTAGFLVDAFDAPGQGGLDNEIEWYVADIASGVYLCHIEAKSAQKTESKIIKIMVVH